MLDLMLGYDAVNQRFDLVYEAPYLQLDSTAATPLLLALGTDRRAQAGDVLPDTSPNPLMPASLIQRRGTPMDALDAQGRLFGCRMWLLNRAKSGGNAAPNSGAGVAVRKRAEGYVAEPLNDLASRIGPTQVTVAWISGVALQTTVAQGPAVLATIRQPVGVAA